MAVKKRFAGKKVHGNRDVGANILARPTGNLGAERSTVPEFSREE